MNIWQKLKAEKNDKPILVLAPMADVTDPAFRRIIAKYGKPDVMWTEFVSADGLFLGGRDTLIKDLAYDETERPIIAQFFTSSPERMMQAGMLAVELGFDGLDINMGCPDKSIEKQGAGAGLIRNQTLAQELVRSAKEGIHVASEKMGLAKDKQIPVSVKTRIGYNKNELETWLPALLETEPALITIHARTRKEMSLVPARWEHIARAVEIRDTFQNSNGEKSQTLIFGNGDVLDIADAEQKSRETHCDGVMLGRAIFGNPWCFSREVSRDEVSIPDRLHVMVEHTKLFEELLPHKSFAIMKKHYKAYVHGWDGAKELRMKLMDAKDANEIELIIVEYLKNGSV